MKANRWLCLLLAICLVFTLTACGGGGGSSSDDPSGGGGGQSVISGPWLCFTSTGESTVSMIKNYPYHTVISLEYSKNGEPWKDFVIGTTTVNLADGDKVYLRGDNISFSDNTGKYVKFVMTGPGTIAASGNVMSLVDKTCASTTIPNDSCFCYLFENCSIMTTAPELPAIVLKSRCYLDMFKGCSKLTTAPDLPSPSLANGCYSCMFEDCSKLTTAPDLLSQSLATGCYSYMFYGCTSLTVAPDLPSPSLADSCYQGMFQGCSELTTAPELPATNLAEFCYYSMFQGCSKLTTAPELPATSLPNYCYFEMFKGCSKLNYIKVRFTDWNVLANSTMGWVDGVADSGKFHCPALLNTTSPDTSKNPVGWAVNP